MEVTFEQVTVEEVAEGGGADIDVDTWHISSQKMYTTGLNTCYAIGLYGKTSSGVEQMLLCHAAATFGGGDGENAVRMLIDKFGVEQNSLVIVVVAGSKPCRQYFEAKELANFSFEPQFTPPPGDDDWNVEVAMLPDGTVQWAPLPW